ncbi:MAG: glycerol-3-phosphate dehydrogenase/oxidase [Deltaproteobacteria bacterium]|nr:glycerol-3-phosphate dehydrogenase/oxidase [Candidatus Deferrimicrobium borealis]
MKGKEYDLVIVGGGIFGACAAWDAARRGLKVALLEKKDFSHATSANHLKMVHGGIRYLQHGDLVRVWESCRERTALLKIAPHLVRPLPIVMPTYGHGKRGKTVLGVGVSVYDLLTMDRNRRIADEGRKIPGGRLITRQQVLDHFPGIEPRGLTGAAVFYDAQMYSPPRIALSFLRSAASAGADIANYVEVTRFLRSDGRVVGVGAKDVLGGENLEVRGKVVLNAAGPWAARLLETGTDLGLAPKPVFSRDACFVVSRRISEEYALACQTRSRDADAIISRGGRHLFLAPWRGFTLIGVWHGVYRGAPEDVGVTEEELQAFLDETNAAYPGLSLARKDVTMVNFGLILFEDTKQGGAEISFGKRSLLIDHEKTHHVIGLVTLIGVRATTARGMAEKAVNLVFRKLGKTPPRSDTEITPIFGGRIEKYDDFLGRAVEQRPFGLGRDVLAPLIHNYGSEYPGVLKYIDGNPEWAHRLGDSTVLKAEVVHAVREEMAEKIGDVVFRRTDMGTGGHPGEVALLECARLMASELGWDEDRVREEIDEVREEFLLHHSSTNIPDKGSILKKVV